MTLQNKLSGKMIPMLTMDNAKSAIELYEKALGAKVLGIRYDDKDSNIVKHSQIQIEESSMFVSDSQAYGSDANKSGVTQNAKFYLHVQDADVAFQKAISNGMKEAEPMQDAFWGHRFGSVVDDYGIGWCFGTPKSSSSK